MPTIRKAPPGATAASTPTLAADPKIIAFLEQLARMETESEFDERTGDSMSGDDAVDAISDIIENARALLKQVVR